MARDKVLNRNYEARSVAQVGQNCPQSKCCYALLRVRERISGKTRGFVRWLPHAACTLWP